MQTATQLENEKPVWTPLPGSQTLALSCPADIILYHGSRGPGKTDAQLMRFRQRVGMGYGQFWRGIIFDREYKNLDDLIAKSVRWFKEFGDGAKFLSSKSDYRWVWPTGEELYFRHIKRPQDYWAYHGQEFPFIGWNELTKYPTPELFENMMSCNRSSFVPDEYPIINHQGERTVLPEIPLEVFATTNPFGAGHNWVKKRFINKGPPGKIHRNEVTVFNPRTQQEETVVRTQTHIFGSYRENRFLSPAYIAELVQMSDKNKRKAWLGGSWDVVAGGMFDDVWDSAHHIVRPFDIPGSWTIDRSFDWGSSKPFSVGWWAHSDGSDVKMPDGSWRSTVRGDVFRIAEWYGTNGKANEGLKMLAKDIAKGIIEREISMGIYKRVKPGPADNSIFSVENGSSVGGDMKKKVRLDSGALVNGVRWAKSNKKPGSRKLGWEKVRTMLESALPNKYGGPREMPGLFCFDNCEHFIDLFPTLPRDEKDPDDVDTDAEDHIGDETRYEVLSLGKRTKSGATAGV